MADIHHIFHIDAPRRDVFEAISTVDGFKNWWTKKTTGKVNVGGIVKFGFTPGVESTFKVSRKQIHELIELVYHGHLEDEWFNTKIIFRLSVENGLTKVSFQHNNFQHPNEFYAQCNFTWGQYLKSLKDYCETGMGAPFGFKP